MCVSLFWPNLVLLPVVILLYPGGSEENFIVPSIAEYTSSSRGGSGV